MHGDDPAPAPGDLLIEWEDWSGASGVRHLRPGEEMTIGRTPDNGLHLAAKTISRRHARVFYASGGWWAEDLISSSGTFVDGQRHVRGPLPPRGVLRCGDRDMPFEVVGAAPAPGPERPG